MALDKTYLESLGLEIAKRKYYNATKVESVIEDLNRRSTALEEENRALRSRIDAVTFGREEIGDAILSAKTIAQQLIAEAKEKSEQLVHDAQAESERMLREARAEADRIVAEAQAQRDTILSDCDGREREAFCRVQNCYEHLREQYVGSLRLLDSEWQRFLCSLGEEAQSPPRQSEEAEDAPGENGEALPEDIAQKVSQIADQLLSLSDESATEV